MKHLKYQERLSLASPILLDEGYKGPKVEKLVAVLRHAGIVGEAPLGLAVDVGCSGGLFVRGLAPLFAAVCGVDIDDHALALAHGARDQDNQLFVLGDSMRLPLADDSVDLAVCNHVYEHVPDAERLLAEIYRVLRPGAWCYLGAASRLTLVEPHYHLPFLSMLPKPLAHAYMRATGKGDYYYENLRTYWGIRRLVRRFEVVDYTLKVVANPDTFRARDLFPEGGLLARIPSILWKLFYPLLPGYILLLRKPHAR
jgi:SAM-dependent methyltransferase